MEGPSQGVLRVQEGHRLRATLFLGFHILTRLMCESCWQAAAVGDMAPRVQFSTYACVSTALTAALVSYAFQTRIQFYPAVIFLVTSKISLLILGNMGTQRHDSSATHPASVALAAGPSQPCLSYAGGLAGLMMTLLLGRITKAVFFGQLRDVEIEILYDNARYAVTETCLALTIFREELTTR